jgi:ATP-dependent metalloprotease
MKTGPHQSEFEPKEGNVVKFSDVQGVDEAKEVLFLVEFLNNVEIGISGTARHCIILEGPRIFYSSWW